MKKISKIFIVAITIAAVFTSCKKTLPTAGFTYAPTTIVQYDQVAFTNTSTDASTYSWDFGGGALTSTEANPSIQFMTAGDIVVKLTATNEDGDNTYEETITVAAPDNYYELDGTKYAITTDFFWYSAMGMTYIRLLTAVEGQDNPDLIKLYPNMGTGELPRTYTWDADTKPVGTYYYGYTANYAGMAYDWTAIGKTGAGDLVVEELETDVYRITCEMVLSVGSYDWSTGAFTETSTKTLKINYIGAITPL